MHVREICDMHQSFHNTKGDSDGFDASFINFGPFFESDGSLGLPGSHIMLS